jgi:hypothetical protein
MNWPRFTWSLSDCVISQAIENVGISIAMIDDHLIAVAAIALGVNDLFAGSGMDLVDGMATEIYTFREAPPVVGLVPARSEPRGGIHPLNGRASGRVRKISREASALSSKSPLRTGCNSMNGPPLFGIVFFRLLVPTFTSLFFIIFSISSLRS